MDHTIAAIATAPGEGGIGIVRISGSDSLMILKKIFRYKSGKELTDIQERRMIYGDISDNGEIIDEAMVVYMKSPHTYTGEDVVEIQCHGSMISLKKILQLVIHSGASLAERGEFTMRAFLNGKMDLSQAEAVIDIIKAKSGLGFESAVSQLQGSLSGKIGKIRKKMADLISEIAVQIEYPEEDLEELNYEKLTEELSDIADSVRKLIDSADTGRAIKDGLSVSIVGRPNVGKSSLLNAILKIDRAIVTDIPGTTRDTIEEFATIGGIPVRITDTAGIRKTEDTIEKIGIEKSMKSMDSADVVILVLDGSSELTSEDMKLIEETKEKKSIIIINKTDLEQKINADDLYMSAELSQDYKIIEISAYTGDGVEAIENEIQRIVYNGESKPQSDVLITNVRHEELLRNAVSHIRDGSYMLENGEALDFAEMDLREAWMLLGEITGESVNDDIVKEVFSRFCLGK